MEYKSEFSYEEEKDIWKLTSVKGKVQFDSTKLDKELNRYIFNLPCSILKSIDVKEMPHQIIIYTDKKVDGFQDIYPFDNFHFENDESNGLNIVFRCERGMHHHFNSRYNLGKYLEDLAEFCDGIENIEVVPKGENENHGLFYGLVKIKFITGNLDQITHDSISKLCGIIDEFEKEISGLRGFRYLLDIWATHKDKKEDEEFWQKKFSDNPWVLAQLFAVPFTCFKEKYYAGGKNIGNQGGVFPDFLFKEQYTPNVAVIEIKTPDAKLVEKAKEYRNGAYKMAEDLNGGVIQVLKQRDIFLKDVKSIREQSSDVNKYYDPINPRCYLIVGSNQEFSDELVDERRESFNLFRNELRSIEVLTFDEVFSRIETILEIAVRVSKLRD